MATAPKYATGLRFKNILFTTDFSACSEAALPFARALATRYSSTLHLAHIIPPAGKGTTVPGGAADEDVNSAADEMSRFLLRHPLRDITHEMIVERGALWHTLETIVQNKQIDLIVSGTHGRRGLKKLVLGSAAEEIFRHATCPVVTIGPHSSADGLADGRISSVLYATDFSKGSSRAMDYAVELAREHRARLVLLHVLPHLAEMSSAQAEKITSSCREQLVDLITPGAAMMLRAEAVVRCGTPAEEILRTAEEEMAGLIVMGARAASGSASVHVPWATAHGVVCEAKCPVLTVRHSMQTVVCIDRR